MSDTTPEPTPAPPTWPAPPEPAAPAWAAQPDALAPAAPAWATAPPQPEAPAPAAPAWATAPPPEPDFPVEVAASEATPASPGTDAPLAPSDGTRPRLNALAVAALILAVLLSPLAALFGHIAAVQVARSQGRERGAVIAWIALGFGYLWLVGGVVLGYAVWQLLGL